VVGAVPGGARARAVIVVDVQRVSDSCGWAVPLMEHRGERDLLAPYFDRRGVEGSADHRRRKNRTSVDALPAFDDDPLDEWATPEGLATARRRMEQAIDGWRSPVAWGVAADGGFSHVNRPGGRHGLASVVLASVLEHDGSTATLELSSSCARRSPRSSRPRPARRRAPEPEGVAADLGVVRRPAAAGGLRRRPGRLGESEADATLRSLVPGRVDSESRPQ
jgi:hypothetical protein